MNALAGWVLLVAGHATAGPRMLGGEPSSDEAVVALVPRRTACEAEPIVACTGVVIAPRVVLTAAHCVIDARSEWAPFEVLVGASIIAPDVPVTSIQATTALAHPDFDRDSRARDLALLLLAEPVPGFVTPMQLPTAALQSAAAGRTARAIGFGVDHVDGEDTGAHTHEAAQRTGEMVVDTVDTEVFRTTPAPGMSCFGDSGGPVLVDDGTGTFRLFGITSGGDEACATHADNAQIAPVVSEWITPFLAAAETGPDGWNTATVELDDVCVEHCASDQDCPAAMRCMSTAFSAEPTCVLPGAGAASYGPSCSDSEGCVEGSCVALWPGECRCAIACEAETPGDDSDPPDDSGMDTASRADEDAPACGCTTAPSTSWLGLALALALLRTRR